MSKEQQARLLSNPGFRYRLLETFSDEFSAPPLPVIPKAEQDKKARVLSLKLTPDATEDAVRLTSGM